MLCPLLLLAAPATASPWPTPAGAGGHMMELRSSASMLLTLAAMQATPAAPALPGTATPVQPPAVAPVQPPSPATAQPLTAAPTQPLAATPAQPNAGQPAEPNTAGSAQPFPSVPGELSPTQPNPNQLTITGLGGGSAQWTILVLLTFLTLIPSILICMTPFARLLIVFHFLRQALGLQTTPSNQTLIGLSVIMTFFIMQPIGMVIYRDSVVPLQAGRITAIDALTRAGTPMREFMSHYVREKDAALFLEMAKEPRPANVGDLSFRVLLPAYILSELKAGFQIGAVLFLPFLVVDMVVASITTSVGMMQLPPVVISTPLKLLLFLMVDGWHLLIGALMRSFN
jgi:flagellar biosynthetic protein FliP